jgi:5-methylcytosine-specific restriction endonuclease McrA
MFPKPKKADRARRKRLTHKEKTKARRSLYRKLIRPAYLAGLAAGQGRKGEIPLCERCAEFPALTVHHRGGREGDLVMDPENLDGLCEPCHAWAHANPQEAMAEGWLTPRNRPVTPPS